MVRINKTQFPPALRKEVWGKVFKIAEKSSSPEKLSHNFASFLTSSELALLEKRIATLLLLEKGKSYREIGRIIDVTRSTVSYIKHRFIRNHYPKKKTVQKREDPYWHHISPASEMRKQIKEDLQRKRKWG